MISRGEVALIVASKGVSVELMNTDFFWSVVMMVVITTILTPISLKLVFSSKTQVNPTNPTKIKLSN